ncbi:MAG: LUD domain-containing protein [Trueperaceae bacterium]
MSASDETDRDRSARDDILARVARATEGVRDDDPDAAYAALPRAYREADDLTPTARLDRFEQRLVDYGVDVVRSRPDEVPERLIAELARRRAHRVVLPRGLPPAWRLRLRELQPVADDADPLDLDGAHATVSECDVAIAETGTIVLSGGPGQGRRAASLVPDLLLCVVPASRLVGTVPEATRRLQARVVAGAALTWISGPSATSDIELVRVAGVHGPRRLLVLLVTDGPPGA